MLKEALLQLAHDVPETRKHLIPLLRQASGERRRVRRYYHASPKRFRNGDVLEGNHPGGYGYCHDKVCLTDSPSPHYTISDKAIRENWFVYEVEPLEKVGYAGGNDEFQTGSAKVLKMIGRAKPIFEHARGIPSKVNPRPSDMSESKWKELSAIRDQREWLEWKTKAKEPKPPNPALERYKRVHWDEPPESWPGNKPKKLRNLSPWDPNYRPYRPV